MAVNAGDQLTYQATVSVPPYSTIDSIVANVSADAQSAGFQVYQANSQSGGLLASLNPFSSTNDTLELIFTVPQSYGSVDDVKSIIDGFVYKESGSAPVASSINDNGAVGVEPSALGASGSTGGVFSSLSTWFSGAGTGALIALVLAVVVIFFVLDYTR